MVCNKFVSTVTLHTPKIHQTPTDGCVLYMKPHETLHEVAHQCYIHVGLYIGWLCYCLYMYMVMEFDRLREVQALYMFCTETWRIKVFIRIVLNRFTESSYVMIHFVIF